MDASGSGSGSRPRGDKEKEEDEKEMLEMLEQRRGYVQAWSLRPLNQPSLRHRLAHLELKIAQQHQLRALATRDQCKDPDPTSKQDGTRNAEDGDAPDQDATRNGKDVNAPDQDSTRNADKDDDEQQKNPPNE
ncbi:hypothetical protein Fmac_011161 [Flemingia macrophylla]|uniref:Uncharacterized protein n=1 Tax=Flemingia macrophylla TaxID=520843 RepID=A0ABD1MLN8_9FABA